MPEFQKLYGPNAAKNPDNVLEQAICQYESCFIMGWDKEGQLDFRASTNLNATDFLYLIERFKFKFLSGDFGKP